MITNRSIEQLKARLDIIEVVGHYLELKKSGANYKAECPFHIEDTPSFTISPAKQICSCFGCGVGGDAIGFVMKYESLEYPEAIEKLADMYNFSLEYTDGSNENKFTDIDREITPPVQKPRIKEKSAVEYHIDSFKRVDEFSNEAREFLRNRGIVHIPEHAYSVEVSHQFEKEGREPFTIRTRGVCLPVGDLTNAELNKENIKEYGIDIHLYEPYERQDGTKTKTQSFGNKGATFIRKPNSPEFSIIESKMDKFACDYLDLVIDSNRVIANGTAQAEEIIQHIKIRVESGEFKEEELCLNHFNQNDYAGYKFNSKIASAFPRAKHFMLNYLKDEHGWDVNDLTEKGTDLLQRRVPATIGKFNLKTLAFQTKKIIDFIVDGKREKVDKLMYVYKNMHKFYESDVPLSNLLLSCERGFLTKQDTMKQLDFPTLKANNVYLNKGTEGMYLYKKVEGDESDSYRAVKHFDITQTNLMRNKDAYDAYDPDVYYSNEIDKVDYLLNIFVERFNQELGNIKINHDLESNRAKLFDTFKQMTSQYIESEHLANVVSFVLYSRVDYKSVELFNEQLETSFLASATDEAQFKKSLNAVLQNSQALYEAYGMNEIMKEYKVNVGEYRVKDRNLKTLYPSYQEKSTQKLSDTQLQEQSSTQPRRNYQ